MLIYSKERLVPTDVNMLVIRAKDEDGYFYIHRALYDQAVIINDIYGESPNLLIKALTNSEESRGDVDRFLEEVPTPINIFGPFLLLVKHELEDFEDMVGAIHVMSGPLHLRNMLKIPFDMRNMTPTFSLSIKDEYKLAWDRFFQTAIPYSENMFITQTVSPMNGVHTTTVESEEDESEAEEEEKTGYEEYGIDSEAMDFLFSDEDPFAELDDMNFDEDEDDTTPKEEAASEAPYPTVAEEPVVEEEVEEEKPAPKLSVVDRLIGLA